MVRRRGSSGLSDQSLSSLSNKGFFEFFTISVGNCVNNIATES
jgi:hypothetical protein